MPLTEPPQTPAQDHQFASFADFYPYYLNEHRHPVCRLLHFVGSWLVVIVAAYCFYRSAWWGLLSLPLIGYGFAWLGHFGFEKNKPATFRYPLYSLIGDWRMWADICLGRQPLWPRFDRA